MQKQAKQLKKIIIFRALRGLGDFLCVVPAFRALRAAYPSAEIVLVSLEEQQPLVERFSNYVDELMIFTGFPGLLEKTPQVRQIPAFFASIQEREFDLALQMHGSGGNTNPVTALLGARNTAGFFNPGQYCPDESRFLPYIEEESEILRYLRLLEHNGIPSQGSYLEFPITAEDMAALQTLPETRALRPREFICIHPGASTPASRWHPEGFAAVADALAEQGLQIVLTGTAGERGLAQTVGRMMRAPHLNIAGRTPLGALAAILRDARMLICNDTGVSHVAAALRLPSVVIFTDARPSRWGPLDRTRHRVIARPEQESIVSHHWTSGITPEMVLSEAFDLLNQGITQPPIANERIGSADLTGART